MNKILFATVLLSSMAVAQQPCPTGYHHEGDSAACWPDVSRQQEHPGVQPIARPTPAPVQPAPPAQTASVIAIPQSGTQPTTLICYVGDRVAYTSVKVSLDDIEIGKLKRNKYFTFQTQPGRHNLTLSGFEAGKQNGPLVIDLKPGNNYVEIAGINHSWQLISVPAEIGEYAISKIKK